MTSAVYYTPQGSLQRTSKWILGEGISVAASLSSRPGSQFWLRERAVRERSPWVCAGGLARARACGR